MTTLVYLLIMITTDLEITNVCANKHWGTLTVQMQWDNNASFFHPIADWLFDDRGGTRTIQHFNY